MSQRVIHRPSYGGVNATHCWTESNYCGVVSWNGWFRLYDLGRKEFVQEFNVPDTGGMSAAVKGSVPEKSNEG